MKTSFELVAELRDAQGKSASRRLRHTGKVPAILYGGHADASQLALEHQKLLVMLDNEKFYSSIIAIKLGDKMQPAILKDIQRHPAKNIVLHVDLQRVLDNEKIRMTIPLHFKGAAGAPGVKTEGGLVSHLRNDVDVLCLPKDLPEFLEVDLSEMHVNDVKRLSDIKRPDGVELVDLTHGRDVAVVSIPVPRRKKCLWPPQLQKPLRQRAQRHLLARRRRTTRRRAPSRRQRLPRRRPLLPRRKVARSSVQGVRPAFATAEPSCE
jgi:large subunit ribosomal protein L25